MQDATNDDEYGYNVHIHNMIAKSVERAIENHEDDREAYTDTEYQRRINILARSLLFERLGDDELEGYGIRNITYWVDNEVAGQTSPWEMMRESGRYYEWTNGSLIALLYYSRAGGEWVARLDDTSIEGDPLIDRKTSGYEGQAVRDIRTMMAIARKGGA